MKITTTKKFNKQFKKQPKKIQHAFADRITVFMHDKYDRTLNTHRLSGNYKGLWSFNVSGDIRVIFDESPGNDTVMLIAIGSHSELYR